MSKDVKTCIATGCMNEVGVFPPMCSQHWGLLPDGLQDEVRRVASENAASERYWSILRAQVDLLAAESAQKEVEGAEIDQRLEKERSADDRKIIIALTSELVSTFTHYDRYDGVVMSSDRFRKAFEDDDTLVYDVIATFAVELIKWAVPNDGTTLLHLFHIVERTTKRLKEAYHG